MSAHVEDRLSAYLDDALSTEARAEVEAHLQDCPQCSAARRDLQRVDALARQLPAEPPAGYFDALPGRVRARIEGQRRRAAFAPPVWAWAAAAALVLAVVAPVTLREARWPETVAPLADAVSAPPAADGTTAYGERTTAAEPSDLAENTLRSESTAPTPTAPGGNRPSQAAPALLEALALGREQPAAAVPADPSKAAAEASDELALAPPTSAAPAFAVEPQAPPQRADRPRGEMSAASAKRARPEAALQETDSGPTSAAEAREERERLRRLLRVAERPAGFDTAEARVTASAPDREAMLVRIIELSLRAWQLEADREDLERFRTDAAAYLERPDAEHADHVRRLLLSVRAEP